MLIGVDVDEVCADMLTVWVQRYNELWQDNIKREDITAWDMRKFVKPECHSKVYEILHDGNIYEDVQPIPGALYAVTALRNMGHRVIFISSCVRDTIDHKVSWLVKHKFLPKQNSQPDFIAAVDKHLINVHVLFDDNAETVAKFPGGRFLVDQPHNRAFPDLTWTRVASLAEAPRTIAWAYGCPSPAGVAEYQKLLDSSFL